MRGPSRARGGNFRPIVLLFGLAAVAAAGGDAAGQTPPQTPLRLGLGEAIARATETSHRLAAQQALQAGAREAVRGRQAASLPSLAVTAGYTRTNHVDEFGVPQPDGSFRLIYPDIPDTYRTRLFAQWPIYAGGRTRALERAAAAEAGAVDADLEAARADLRLEVVQAYWRLATANESVRVLEEALARAEAHLHDVRSRFDAGFVPPNDVLSVEAQRSSQELQLIEARNLREGAGLDLRRLIGVEPDTPMELTEPLDGASAVPAGDGDTAGGIADAVRQRPERAALAARLAGAEDRMAAARAGRRPAVNLAGGVDYARPNTRIFPLTDEWRSSWDIGVNVSWTLWDSGRTAAAVAEAAAGASAVRSQLSDLDARLAMEIRQRTLDLASARAAVRAAADGVRSAAEARRVVSDRYEAGVVPNTEVIDAQVALLQAELDRTRALANVRLAQARLDRALGR